MCRTAFTFAAFLFVAFSSGHAADKPADPLAALERKLHGHWRGGACQGNWTYLADGTFTATHYSPGNNKLAGTWSIRWDALPPTFVRNIKLSDDKDLTGKSWEVSLVELTDKRFTLKFTGGGDSRYERMSDKENAEEE